MAEKTILDVCCGSRMFWFDKHDERVVFCDKRKERHILNYDCGDYDINVSPNVLSDFTALPFPSNHFQVVVFDPPHLKKIGEKFTFKTRLDLFSNYKKNPQNIDVFWSNVLTASITKHINFSLNVDMIYDDDTKNVDPTKGPAPQWLELMGIGFAYNFGKK